LDIDQIVEAVRAVRIDKAIANPFSCSDALIDICDNFESRFNTVILNLAGLDSGKVVFP
jgi:hypothetical protein